MNDTNSFLEEYFHSLTDEQLLYFYGLYISEVPTPFHKPNLIRELLHFFQLPENIEAQVSLLTRSDLDMIASVMFAKNPVPITLKQILSCSSYSSGEVEKNLVNLEERMVVLPLPDKKSIIYAVSPALRKRLSQIISLETLFPQGKSAGTHKKFWFSPSLFAAWLSVLKHCGQLFTSRGLPKHQRLDELDTKFPGLRETWGKSVYDHLSNTAIQLHAAIPSSGGMTVDVECVEKLFSHEPESLLLIGSLTGLTRSSEIQEGLLAAISECGDRWISAANFLGTLILLSGMLLEEAQLLLEQMTELGIVQEASGRYSFAPIVSSCSVLRESRSKPRFILSRDLSIHIEDHQNVSNWYILYRFCVLEQYDRMVIMKMTRESILGALDGGMQVREIIQLLEEFTGQPLPVFIMKVLEDWASSFLTLSLYQGVVLQCDQRIAKIIRNHPTLSQLIRKELSPDIFLFSRQDAQELRSRLIEAGVPFVPNIDNLQGKELTGSTERLQSMKLPMRKKETNILEQQAVRGDILLNQLKEELSSLTQNHDLIAELSYRIDEKLVLSSMQLKNCSWKRTIFEARGFDYQGKLQLIRQALKAKSDILVLTLNQQTDEFILLKPERLFREGNSDILQGSLIPHNEPFTISAAKLFHVRKIRKPLYLPKRDM